jgi:hypothetical protein
MPLTRVALLKIRSELSVVVISSRAFEAIGSDDLIAYGYCSLGAEYSRLRVGL